MSRFYDKIDQSFSEFIDRRKMFLVATAPLNGRVNVSPKGMDTFRIVSHNRVAYLDVTGSGNETAAHVSENGRITFMFMSFGKQPMILRLYGVATIVQPGEENWDEFYALFPKLPGVRQIFVADISSLQTSCGFGIPEYELKKERSTLNQWARAQGEGMVDYWADHNLESIDGLPTKLKIEGREGLETDA
ncbi:pyridoxamine 5'-phosphate oxidase family protein [Xanthobacter dioxanivorans]|uniref:Pyridoxamine 5'-phosphate oxidase family protein n=1 Tax=Xanthobacter dioxanivorans TaxID=2528964 RepID=A0A974SHP4_9HYPH|nr:pyridoxamine 5'-phosphate oxidase family protein [Xanthobacter dioxanivorans]QRG05557.1 pyridoxamine 5'-phosphate oxidase family protein [Xanthobacter dioxanivorans]